MIFHAADEDHKCHNRLAVDDVCHTTTQGSSFLATLG